MTVMPAAELGELEAFVDLYAAYRNILRAGFELDYVRPQLRVVVGGRH